MKAHLICCYIVIINNNIIIEVFSTPTVEYNEAGRPLIPSNLIISHITFTLNNIFNDENAHGLEACQEKKGW